MNLPRALTEVPNWDEPKFENPLVVSADSDGDGVCDPWDCQPFNPAEQGWFDDKVKSFTRRTGRRIVQGAQQFARRSMSPSQRQQSKQQQQRQQSRQQQQRQQSKQQQQRQQSRQQQQRQQSRQRQQQQSKQRQQRQQSKQRPSSSGRGSYTVWAPRAPHYVSRIGRLRLVG